MTVTPTPLTTVHRRTPARCRRQFSADCTLTVTASEPVHPAATETAPARTVTSPARSSGSTFVVVPGGFIIVLVGLYDTATGFASLLGVAASRLRRTHASRERRTNPSFENASPSSRSSSGRRGAIAPRPIAVGFTNDRAVGSAANVLLGRRGSDDVDLVAPLERRRVPDRQDGAQALERASTAAVLPGPLGRTPCTTMAGRTGFMRHRSTRSRARA